MTWTYFCFFFKISHRYPFCLGYQEKSANLQSFRMLECVKIFVARKPSQHRSKSKNNTLFVLSPAKCMFHRFWLSFSTLIPCYYFRMYNRMTTFPTKCIFAKMFHWFWLYFSTFSTLIPLLYFRLYNGIHTCITWLVTVSVETVLKFSLTNLPCLLLNFSHIWILCGFLF